MAYIVLAILAAWLLVWFGNYTSRNGAAADACIDAGDTRGCAGHVVVYLAITGVVLALCMFACAYSAEFTDVLDKLSGYAK